VGLPAPSNMRGFQHFRRLRAPRLNIPSTGWVMLKNYHRRRSSARMDIMRHMALHNPQYHIEPTKNYFPDRIFTFAASTHRDGNYTCTYEPPVLTYVP